MSEDKPKQSESKQNKWIVGPGLGLIIIGLAYLVWWLIFIEYAIRDPRWTHNFAYAIIILNVGLAWYHKTPLSRTIAMIQSFMLPVTGSGSFNTVLCTIICSIILVIWALVVLIERKQEKTFLEEKLSRRGMNWVNMHALILAWILIAHMGLMFLIVRLPLEAQLYSYSDRAGYLMNLPPESHELATWAFDIGLFILITAFIWEQYKMGYNIKNNPWPKKSFYIAILVMVAALIALALQEVTFGLDWVDKVYG
jgi:hypothetical protein